MMRQPTSYEKQLFDIVKDYYNRFYYESIFKMIDKEQYKVKIEKDKEEMVGRATVRMKEGARIDYEIRYNRVVNLNEGYTLLIPGCKAG